MRVGALADYINGYTNCIDKCDFDKSDKTQRLGYDNILCLLNCNNYYSNLERERLPDRKLYQDNFPQKCLNEPTLNKQFQCYQTNYCLQQCNLNKHLMTDTNMKICKNKCLFGSLYKK